MPDTDRLAVTLTATLYLPPGHAPHPVGSTIALPRALAEQLIEAKHARLAEPPEPPAEPAAHEPPAPEAHAA